MNCSALLLFAAVAAAQTAGEDVVRGKQEFFEYLHSRAAGITARAFDETGSKQAWEKVRQKREQELRDMLGLSPWPQRTPLRPIITGNIDRGDYTIEKLAFESLPKVYVTANLYLPKRRAGKVPGIVYVCGHSMSADGAKVQYQRHGISFARNGYAALVVDPIQIAETFALHHGPFALEMYDWYSRGYSPGGPETWNAIRAVDYLITRPEVDGRRIGITGRSGGAATSWYAGALDPRIAAVAPVMGLGTYEQHIAKRTQALHCDCMFPINFFAQDGIHQAALIAPRPLLMGHGAKDVLFPGYIDVAKGLESLYRSYDVPRKFESLVVDTGHADSDFLREKAIRFFDEYLLNEKERKLEMSYTNLPGPELAVFAGKPPKDALNYRLHEIFIPEAKPAAVTTRAAWEKRRNQLTQQLRSKVFGQMPAGAAQVSVERLAQAADVPQGYENLRLTSPGRLPVRVLIRRPKDKSATRLPALLLIASDGESPKYLNSLLSAVNVRDNAVRMLVIPQGSGETPWDRDFWKAATRHAMQIGETVDSIRLASIVMAVEALRKESAVDPARIMVAGRGNSAALALYTAILDDKVQQVMMLDAPETHENGPVLLNVLRYTDLPEAAGLIAPRHLTFYSRMPKAYNYTRQIFGVLGVPGNISVAMQIDRVLEGRYDHGFASGL